eukprot:TRINITY_DN5188_c0_g1_i2.p1 TRINITY_DN5188_c0_g1~~TRINITY_DN5188_c0_g1_i2.p1  ORF type:complete len:717 (-),score=242.41 TRINITY_DN5188_c0_g1_i2:128-2239(-)
MLRFSSFVRSAPALRSSTSFFRNASSSSDVPVRPIEKLLIANRGEIACRIMKTAKRLGIRTVAVYSEADRYARHVSMADESYLIGPPPAAQSYLQQEKILEVAHRSGAHAIHPGYGFLSENESFAKNCDREGVIFVGPPVPALNAMASKSASKDIMINAGVPVVPGYHGEDQSMERFKAEADKMKGEFPLIAKAFLGGGGKGMRIVNSPAELEECISSCQREAAASFGDERVLIEKYLQRPRHIEFQVFADKHGNYMHLFERDCSLQRRHQKVIEEAPAPGMTAEWRNEMGTAAVNAAVAVGYEGAGTVEFIVDHDKRFFFMEMNTRLQVEHPVTEMITGQDLVEWQILAASGHKLPLTQADLSISGHSFEARVYAEDPEAGFLPCTGKLVHLSPPQERPDVRVETGVRKGDEVSVYYDPMIAKLVVHDVNRERALRKLCENLRDYQIAGLSTNIPFLLRCAEHPSFVAGDVETNFIPKYEDELLPPADKASYPTSSILFAIAGTLLQEQISVDAGEVRNPWSQLSGFTPNLPKGRQVQLGWGGEEPRALAVEYKRAGRPGEIAFAAEVDGTSYDILASFDHGDSTRVTLSVDGLRTSAHVVPHGDDVHVFVDGKDFEFTRPSSAAGVAAAAAGSLLAPMPGKITRVLVNKGDVVEQGDALIIMEAMKMEHTIKASHNGTVEEVFFAVDDIVADKAVLARISE